VEGSTRYYLPFSLLKCVLYHSPLVEVTDAKSHPFEGFECFYEKVIKVKADVAALLNLFSDVSIDVRW
jgi:hypothetical protein